MEKNSSPFDLNFPPLNLEFDGNSDPIAATLQLSGSHDGNHIMSVVYPDCSDYIQPGSLHAHLLGTRNVVIGTNEPAGICCNGSTLNIQIGENMSARSHWSNDVVGTVVSPDINHAQQNLVISGDATEFNNCASVNSIPLGHWSCHPTDATKLSWKNMDSCDNIGNPVLGNSHLNSTQYDNGQQIMLDLMDGSATNVPLTTEQNRNGFPVDYLSCVNGLPSVQLDENMLDLKTASSGLFYNEWGQIIEGCNSQRLSTLPNTQLPLNRVWMDTGFQLGSNLIDSYNFSASTQHSNIIDGGIVGQMGNDLRVVGGWPATAYAAGGNTPQAVFQRNVVSSNNTFGRSVGWTGVGGITGLQHNHNILMSGDSDQLSMVNMREAGENVQKTEVDTCSTAPNVDTSGLVANGRTEGPSLFDRRILPHQPIILDKEPNNVAVQLTRHLVSKPCSVRPNSLNGNLLSGFQSSLSNRDSHDKSMHQGIWNPVASSKEHKQAPFPFLPQTNMSLKGPDNAFSKGQTSSNLQGLSGSGVKAIRKDANMFSSVSLENNLNMNLPRPPYLPTVPASTQPAFTCMPPAAKPAPMGFISHTSGAMNNTTTICPSSTVVGQGTLGRQSVFKDIKSHTAGALNDATLYSQLSTGFPQVLKESKTPTVPQMSAKGQISRLPIQESPHLPRVSTPGRQSVTMGIKSDTAGALNDATTNNPLSTGFPQGRQSVPIGIKSHTAGALNDATTYDPLSTGFPQAAGTVLKGSRTPTVPQMSAKGQISRLPMQQSPHLPPVSTPGRQSLPLGIKNHTAGALNEATTYNPLSTGFPQAAGTVLKGSTTTVPQISVKGQISRLPMQQGPRLPPVSTPDVGYNSGSARTRAKRICLETAKTTLPVCAPKTTVPVCMPGPLGPSTAGKTVTDNKHLPTVPGKKLDHITRKDFTAPVTMPLGARCDLCTNDLMFLPKGSSAAYKDDPPMSAVMVCCHSFHVSCLEEVGCSTERDKDPPCPLCGSPK